MKKVGAQGIVGNMAAWLKAWLTQRKQRVIVNGKKSSLKGMLSGVPQGSVLGPVLFVLFINDLDKMATARQVIKKFGDDTKLAQVIECASDS